jgi:hypothetical protein
MLTAIFSSVGGSIVNAFLGKAMEAFTAYNNKQISMEELRSRVSIAMLDAFKEVEKSHAEALAKTYASFMDALKVSPLLQRMWAWTVGTQLFILFWSQFFVPLFFAYGVLPNWKAGTTGDWAYLLLGACLGMGPLVLRNGPGAGSVTDKLKAMVSK